MAVVIRREDDTAIGHLRGARNMDTPKPLIAYQPFGVGDIATIDYDAVRIMSDQDYREGTMKDRLKEAERLLAALAEDNKWCKLDSQRRVWVCRECDIRHDNIHDFPHTDDCCYGQTRAFLAQKEER